MSMSYNMARNEVKAKAQYQDYEEKLTPEERNIFTDVFTIVGKILTSTRNPEQTKKLLTLWTESSRITTG